MKQGGVGMKRRWMVLVGVLLGWVSVGVAGDWGRWRGPNANGISSEDGWAPTAARELWRAELGVGYSAVSVVQDKLYTMGHLDGEDIVYCLDAKTGERNWSFNYPCKAGKWKGPRATPVVEGNNLYTVSREGQLFCLDREKGSVQWEIDLLKETGLKNIRWGISSTPVVEGNLLLLNVGESGLAVDKRTGKMVWKSDGKHSYATPILFDSQGKRLAAIFSAPGLHLVDAGTGEKIDFYAWETSYDINGADPLVIGDRIFISSGYRHGCALLDFSKGKLEKVWENEALLNQFSSSIYLDGHIYGVDGQTKRKAHLTCIEARSGKELWREQIGFASLNCVNDTLVVLNEKGALLFVKATPAGYKELNRFETGLDKVCWTAPVLANGVVYCRNDKGTLVAVDVRK